MSRNENIFLHRCFDPTRFSYEDAPDVAELKVKIEDALAAGIDVKVPLTKEEQIVAVELKVSFVRFPKPDCGCNKRVSLRERNKMLMHGTAVVVLRDGAAPSTDKFKWTEIVAVPPGRVSLRATTAGGGRLPFSPLGRQIEHGADFSNLLPRNYDPELHEKKVRSELARCVPPEKLNSELRALRASLREQDRTAVYEQESEAPVFSVPDIPDGPVYEKELARTHVSQNPKERRRGITRRRFSEFGVGAHLIKPPK